jgi:hypothetical protein
VSGVVFHPFFFACSSGKPLVGNMAFTVMLSDYCYWNGAMVLLFLCMYCQENLQTNSVMEIMGTVEDGQLCAF